VSPVVDVTVTYLALGAPAQFTPSAHLPEGIHLDQVTGADVVPMASRLYRDVGGMWHWRDRLGWTDAQWAEVMHRPGVELWVARRSDDDTVAGYFELAVTAGEVNINYFGLIPAFIGRGIGGWLLTRAVERAWALGADRITLNTCTLDGEAALPNYRARGFQVVRTVHQRRELPDEPR
jgi:GNAT superfamily N-acetyltransferase